jgi:putative pyrroloquinoline-quinone binding quinoprotein
MNEAGDQMTVSKRKFMIAPAVFALLFTAAIHSYASGEGEYVHALKLSSEGEEKWSRQFDEEPRFRRGDWEFHVFYLAMSTDEIGQMYLSFAVEDSDGWGDIGIFLLDGQGEERAFQQYGMTKSTNFGRVSNDLISDMQRHPSGNGMIFTGYIGVTSSEGGVPVNPYWITIWLDQDGREVWNQVFDGQELPYLIGGGYAWSVAADNFGGIYVSGRFGPREEKWRAPYIVKYNENGEAEWILENIGEWDLTTDGESVLYIYGSYRSNDLYCIDFDGNTIWTKQYDNRFVNEIALTSDGILVATHVAYGNTWEMYKYNSNGEEQWSVFDHSGRKVISLSVDINDNIFVYSREYPYEEVSRGTIAKYSSGGEYLWSKSGPSMSYDLGSGLAMNTDNAGNLVTCMDESIIKYNSEGELLWQIDDYDAEFTQIEIDEEGSIYLAGVSYSDDGNDDDLNDDGDDDTDDDSNDDANDDANADDDDNDDDSSDICGCS